MEGKRVAFLLLAATLAIFLASCRVKADKVDVPYVVGVNANGFYGESKAGADCCDRCGCFETLPLQCFCNDIKSYCPPSCVKCGCTKSIPPQCKCADVNPSFCSTPCRPKP
ncbi:Bowman-Birk type proteinase inhibitor-like [Nymphaea colorata]|nr:Bowman-Birk type proteinase inhibitor-like [Nymphaea colorata]